MRNFSAHNPVAMAVYFLAVAGIAMFCMDPVILLLSLIGSLACFFVCGGRGGKSHLFALGLFLGRTLINPLFSHNGVTVLFVMNHNPITLEALIYGAAASAMIVSVIYWFRAFSEVMTSDRLLYLFGSLSPKLSLILSMALRYVPLFARQAKKVGHSQKALGLYKEDNVVDGFRGGLRIFSVMMTWALENGIITADSMAARGYGLGRRSRFSLFRWNAGDVGLLAASVLLTALAVWGILDRTVAYYPAMEMSPATARACLGYFAYGILAGLPALIQAKEALRWHFLKSGI